MFIKRFQNVKIMFQNKFLKFNFYNTFKTIFSNNFKRFRIIFLNVIFKNTQKHKQNENVF